MYQPHPLTSLCLQKYLVGQLLTVEEMDMLVNVCVLQD